MNKERNIAIDFLKFLAVFFVMNSHMKICYPKYDFLVTGGAIGDALFFFASGFTLLMGSKMRFDNWYKKRINRIYPSIIAAAIFAGLVFCFKEDFLDVISGKRYWFIGCILVYYLFFYPIKQIKDGKYCLHVGCVWFVLCGVIYYIIFPGNRFYGGGLFRCFLFFLFMLYGAYMGKKQASYVFKWYYFLLWVVCIASWYLLVHFGKHNDIVYYLSVIPLLGVTRYTYLIFTAPLFEKIYANKLLGGGIYIISQLCLEVYLIQKFCFTDKLNGIFPLNIPIIMLIVLTVSYIIKIFAELISQTFKTEPYNWKEMLLYKK